MPQQAGDLPCKQDGSSPGSLRRARPCLRPIAHGRKTHRPKPAHPGRCIPQVSGHTSLNAGRRGPAMQPWPRDLSNQRRPSASSPGCCSSPSATPGRKALLWQERQCPQASHTEIPAQGMALGGGCLREGMKSFFFFLKDRVLLYCPGWNAVTPSQLTAGF